MAQLSWSEVYDLVVRHNARPGADLCAVAAAHAESGLRTDAVGDNGISHGIWQMEQGAGLGNGYSAAQLEDPDFAAAIMGPLFNVAYQNGIAAGYSGEQLVRYCCVQTERPFGYPALDCPAADRYAASWYAAVAALSATPPLAHAYDPDTPPERQLQDWTCSVRTATWMANSLGCAWEAGDVQGRMVAAGLVTPADGLLDGTGAALHGWLTDATGCFGVGMAPVTWDWLREHAGGGPIGMGSGTLDHWLAVRRALADGTLELMNPAPLYHGIGDQMDAATFALWAPWNAFSLIPNGTGEDEDMGRIADLETALGYVSHDVADALQGALDSAQGAKAKAARDAAYEALQAAINTLRAQGG